MDRTISLYAHEGMLARMERTNRRLWILCLLLIVTLVGTNAAWVYYENQFQDVVTTIDAQQDGSGINMVGGGDVSYGSEGQDNNEKESP